MKPISPSDVAKHYGFRTLKEVSELTEVKSHTLINWFRDRRALFDIVMVGAAQVKLDKARQDALKAR